MSRWDGKHAIQMFSEISCWIQMSNGGWHLKGKGELLKSIVAKARKNKVLRKELYLQLLKQTRATPDPFLENNVWNLWTQIAGRISCHWVR